VVRLCTSVQVRSPRRTECDPVMLDPVVLDTPLNVAADPHDFGEDRADFPHRRSRSEKIDHRE
jgi:hypothetical protein